MLLITDRDQMKVHLRNRVEILEAQHRRAKEFKPTAGQTTAVEVRQRINGIEEALACIQAWEEHELREALQLDAPAEEGGAR